MNLPELLASLQAAGAPAVLATRLPASTRPAGAGRVLVPPGPGGLGQLAQEVLATRLPRLLEGPPPAGLGEPAEGPVELLLEPLDPARLPPWLPFSCLLLARGKGCVLASVLRVRGELPYRVGDRFAYDDRGHGLLPMNARLSVELHRACARARATGMPECVTLAEGALDLLLEPLRPALAPVLILAAGASRRLGQPKQLVRVDGEPLLLRSVKVALAGGGPVWVVLGYRAQEMAAVLAGLPVTIVMNEEWEEGMAASLRAGVRALPGDASGALFLVCDQLALDAGVLERLQAGHRLRPNVRLACGYGGTRGIPALLPAACFPELLALRGDQGARGLLQGDDVEVLGFPGGERDLDRPEDLPNR